MKDLFEQDEFFSEEEILDPSNKESFEDLSIQLEDLQQAVTWGTDWTCETIVNQIKKGSIDLNPKFQRREAWSDKRKSIFIESIIAGLPIPQIILAEKKEKKGSYIVIDGKQRLISLRRFFSKDKDKDFKSLKLTGMSLVPFFEGLTFEDITNNKSFSELIPQMENQPVRTVIIKNWTNEEFLYSVFLRLNTGSVPLSTQELRQALHPGEFIDFADDFSTQSSEIKRILNIKNPDYRMRDVELVVRYFSFKYYAPTYHGNLKVFFDNSVKDLNCSWQRNFNKIKNDAQELDNAIKFAHEVFGNDSFKKWKNEAFDKRINRAIYDIMVYYFSNCELRKALEGKQTDIVHRFKNLCETDNLFLASFESSTKNLEPTKTRFITWGKALQEICNIEVDIPLFEK